MKTPTRQKPLGARASRPHQSPHARSSRATPWHTRGHLPHLDQPGAIQFVTFRLFDSVPVHVVREWKSELAFTDDMPRDDPRVIELHRRVDRYTDTGHGACCLGDDRVAELVEQALLHFDGVRYRLLAWVIMPNHVHALIETFHGFPLDGVIHSWKSFTSKQANLILGRAGQFWMPDYFDRYIRNDEHLAATMSYIEQNPVQAGLVRSADEWRWGSAFRR